MLTVRKLSDGSKNLTLLVKGFAPVDNKIILDVSKDADIQGLRIDSAVWQIQEKMGLHVWWQLGEENPDSYAMTFESRGSFRLDQGLPGLNKQEGWEGKVYLSSFREDDPPSRFKAFVLVLDFEKLGAR